MGLTISDTTEVTLSLGSGAAGAMVEIKLLAPSKPRPVGATIVPPATFGAEAAEFTRILLNRPS